MIDPQTALRRLVDGNLRHAAGRPETPTENDAARRASLVAGQSPFAAIVGCSDSRVPLEQVFDQGPGALFVVRTAGNIVTETQLGSVEFAVGQLGTRLVLVLGHSGCGAVQATLDTDDPSRLSAGLRAIVDTIRPHVAAVAVRGDLDPATRLDQAIEANVRATLGTLLDDSPDLAREHAEGRIAVVGATYDIGTGRVTFLNQEENSAR